VALLPDRQGGIALLRTNPRNSNRAVLSKYSGSASFRLGRN
jgi:hypothetical protein